MIYSRIASASVNCVLKTSFTYNKCAILGFVFKIQVTVLKWGEMERDATLDCLPSWQTVLPPCKEGCNHCQQHNP